MGLGVFQTPPGGATERAVAAALDAGYRHIDTARIYQNEASVGAAVRRSGLDRDSVFVTTKLWNDDHGFEATLRAFERSRAALGLDVVDLYLIHWPATGRRAETWRALEKLHADGACRSIGVSNFTVRHLTELLATAEVPPAVNQVEFSPFLYQRELLELCRAHGIQLEAYSPLTRARRFQEPVLQAIAADHHATVPQVLLRWGLQHEVVVLPKSVDPGRIRENAGAFDLVLDPEEMARLDALDAGFRVSWDPSEMP